MVFKPQQRIERDATELRIIQITLFDGLYKEDHPNGKRWAEVEIRVDDQNGQPMNWVIADLTKHLPPAMVQKAIDFQNAVRDIAEQEILP